MKRLLVTVNGKRYEVEVEVVSDDEAGAAPAPARPPSRTMDSYVTPAGPPPPPPRPREAPGDGKVLTSPINGVVLEIPVQAGQTVRENDVLFVVEAMKMKTNVSSPQSGRVREIRVKVGDRIEAEQPLLVFE